MMIQIDTCVSLLDSYNARTCHNVIRLCSNVCKCVNLGLNC
jgi:hypothetical protein